MTKYHEAERRLLEEGALSYVPAASALMAFRDLVQSRCRKVVEDRLEEYSAALDVSLDKGQLVAFQTPENEWDGTYASIGLETRNLGEARAWLYHFLWWELQENGTWNTHVGASLWLRKRYQVDQLRKAFHPHPPNAGFDEMIKEVWMSDPITAAEMGDFDKKLDAILVQWIKLWKKVGGLKILSDDSVSEE